MALDAILIFLWINGYIDVQRNCTLVQHLFHSTLECAQPSLVWVP